MKIFDANITRDVSEYLSLTIIQNAQFQSANDKILNRSGIQNFFKNQLEFEQLKSALTTALPALEEPDRTEYGDFQTNIELASSIVSFLREQSCNPEIIVEPTCGKGNFILASLKTFPGIKKIYGVELYKPYIWEIKFALLDYFIESKKSANAQIELLEFNVFDFDFKRISKQHESNELLIIGNPPWVTNSELSGMNSTNLPEKWNIKQHNGLDAITGKGNFDIGEYITLMMLDAFQYNNGVFAFLVKNSVIKNVVYDQKNRSYNIAKLQKLGIDSKKEFGASVDSSLFTCTLNSQPRYECLELDFYALTPISRFGWLGDKFVSDMEHYVLTNSIDGVSPIEWRQGVKHDCSSIMELEKIDKRFINGFDQEVELEEDLVYGILKSSDLKSPLITETRKYTIITQQKVGQDTSFIKAKLPKTYRYLIANKTHFDNRKSIIYKDKPDFSIFGIGDYSFKPYKVAISGLYKNFTFSLILPLRGKPLMLDDTCYFIGFEELDFAVYAFILLNSSQAQCLLQSITFADAKRMFTKDVLMRIDLFALATLTSAENLRQEIEKVKNTFMLDVTIDRWDEFIQILSSKQVRQLSMF